MSEANEKYVAEAEFFRIQEEVSKNELSEMAQLRQENAAMRKALFKLRKDAFLSRLDRWEVLVLCASLVGNQVNSDDK